MDKLPNISIVTILHDWDDFFTLFKHHWETLDYPKDKLEWVFIDDSKKDYSDIIYDIPSDNILYLKVTTDEYLEKIEFPKDDEKIVWNYFHKMGTLPDGFKRDYAVGMTSHDYIFHLDFDCLYQPKTIKRKLDFLQKNKLGCVYCKNMLCYDIYGKQLYKTENKFGYESTLFHTKDFWKSSGFKWEDINSEAVSFYYNKGMERELENYYDTIKVLSVHNINMYQPKQISLENMNINIPEILNEIKVQGHPLKVGLNDIFFEKKIDVLGINSDIMDHIKNEKWECFNLLFDKKIKEKVMVKQIKDLNKKFNLCFINTNFPIWRIFDSLTFDVILFENSKNIEQMDGILKSKDYLSFNGLYFHKNFLK